MRPVDGGSRQSSSAAIDEASHPNASDAETARLRKAWIDGLESAPFVAFDIEAIKTKARIRLGGNPGPDRCP
ncbi:MAG: hypothetical protein EOR72_17515 [Mesorhizobium sp.]|uniref:hypothetical protein n=1 Tax=Mesorhizobium sp. TaxID=1871066 RepID=UPI000FE2B665|nr:hypothetical protein [Mesorhizobium sp.]RWH71516.1 MAG: hypothetical protein EOQ84_15650 [Mesorhizobium sp.]RWL30322.1 MAG: hypothetical protein EOR58_08005 [Mesorhizobium sp.]RWL32638.1 MAG: hypothetical protein EOR63_12900 [Mesorhizobium sp.]RWL39351.1 MAG: hypothetical protein EOR59_10530 [Mesorhizobium sp.]RWL55157.1 MAG: hypothetical protein EOR62_09635 [Mesorhizobium sp.]